MSSAPGNRKEAVLAVLDEVGIASILIIFILYELDKYNVIDLRISPGLLVVIVPLSLILGYIVYLVVKAQAMPPKVGPEALIGEIGTAVDDIDPEGMVLVQGELWRARSLSGERIPTGSKVIIRGVRDSVLLVEAVKK